MGKFIVKETKNGYTFNLKAKNGEVIATSEVYASMRACMKGTRSVRVNAKLAVMEDQTVDAFEVRKNPKFAMYLDKAGEYRFRLKARNGKIIAISEGYQSKASCINGIESVKNNVIDSVVEQALDNA